MDTIRDDDDALGDLLLARFEDDGGGYEGVWD